MMFEAFPTNQLSNNVFLTGDDSKKMLDGSKATWEKKNKDYVGSPFCITNIQDPCFILSYLKFHSKMI